MIYEKLNIKITNEHYFDKIEELDVCIELYSKDVLKFKVYRNSRVYTNENSTLDAYDNSKVYACNNSTVYSYGNSVVYAYNSSKVYAYADSKVYASNSSEVEAYNSSIIYASDSSKIYAKDSSTIYALKKSEVKAYDCSRVYAYDCSRIDAYDYSVVVAEDNSSVYAYEFTSIYIKSLEVTINTINHLGAIVKQVAKLKEDMFVYKKLKDNKIATLKLVKGQVLQSENFGNCRTDKALVVGIDNITKTKSYTTGVSAYNNNFIYEVGKAVIADKYDKNINECSNGIHFFLAREKAETHEL